jgi:hypothetical protein
MTKVKCIRLIDQDYRTIEQWSANILTVQTYVSQDQAEALLSTIPSTGLDSFAFTYVDNGATIEQATNVTLWATNDGWCYVGTDGNQYLITANNSYLYDTYAEAINARNIGASFAALGFPSNPGGFGPLEMLPKHPNTTVWIDYGVYKGTYV